MKTFINLIALTVLAVAGVRADINIALDDPSQTGTAGQTLNFFGTITNTNTTGTQPVYLNNDSLTFGLSDATVVDNFFANVPISLAAGASSGDIDLFDITLANPESRPLGTYTGTYGLLGGMDGGTFTAQDNLAQVSFSVNVTPEPGYFALLGVGLALMVWMHRRRAISLSGNSNSHITFSTSE
jgi:hypothetical protein